MQKVPQTKSGISKVTRIQRNFALTAVECQNERWQKKIIIGEKNVFYVTSWIAKKLKKRRRQVAFRNFDCDKREKVSLGFFG